MIEYILQQIKDSYETKIEIFNDPELVNIVEEVSLQVIEAYKRGNKILFAGNGGSAADAQHLVGELVNRFHFDRPGLAAISLSTDTSVMTAIGNDYNFSKMFSRQIEAIGVEGDIFIGISTSGNSANIIEAMETCQKNGLISVGLSGRTGGKLDGKCDYIIKIPSENTPRIQESHILIGHIICAIVEESLFGKGF
ncbi:MAG: D-sedoheptulose 7-phosphate isomerase [Candidatus Marinimicrobia bacterium]|nr:D-sedoheptulose 7-phosphate isomerase [Candidatus Neomarinimicrobiota bacterium]